MVRSLTFVVLAGLLAAPSTSRGEVKCVFDEQMVFIQQKSDRIGRSIKTMQKQYQTMAQVTYFRTEQERQAHLEEMQKLAEKINQQQAEFNQLGKELTFLRTKRVLFQKSKSGSRYDYFHPASLNPVQLENEAAIVVAAFEQIFPTGIFGSQSKPQIFIYENPEDYTLYEMGPESAIGYSEKRICDGGVIGLPSWLPDNKHLVIALHAQSPDFRALRHMLSHVYLAKYAGPFPASALPSQTSPFIDEGLAENIAAVADEKMYEARARFLLEKGITHPTQGDSSLPSLIKAKEIPMEDRNVTGLFYSEATLFVRWLSKLPDGFQLLRSLVSCHREQVEGLIRTHQFGRGLREAGLAEYTAWRSGELERLKRQFEQEKKGREAASPTTGATNSAPAQ